MFAFFCAQIQTEIQWNLALSALIRWRHLICVGLCRFWFARRAQSEQKFLITLTCACAVVWKPRLRTAHSLIQSTHSQDTIFFWRCKSQWSPGNQIPGISWNRARAWSTESESVTQGELFVLRTFTKNLRWCNSGPTSADLLQCVFLQLLQKLIISSHMIFWKIG